MDREELFRSAIIAKARDWIGTPWKHQHRLKGVGVDCVGLIIAAGVEANVLKEPGDAFHPWRGYSRTPNPNRMRAGLEHFLHPCRDETQVRPGDVAWIAWPEAPDMPMHLAIYAWRQGGPSLIHSSERVDRVVEHGFTGEWPSLVNSWWRYPGL